MTLTRAALAVAYHAPAKRDFMRTVMVPSAHRVAGAPGVEHAFLTRHWRFGPHLQLVVSGTDREQILAALTTEQPQLVAAVAEAPSDYTLRTEPYLAMSEELGRAELVPGPYAPIWDDNSVRLLDEPLLPGLVVHPDAQALRDQFCASTLPVLESVLTRCARDPQQRLIAATELLVTVAAAYPDRGLAHGYLSYRSHLEDYLQDNDRDGAYRADFERRYEAVRPAFEALIRQCVDQLDEPTGYTGSDPAIARWSGAVADTIAGAVPLAGRDQAIDPLLHEDYMERARDLNQHLERKYRVGDDREYSDFHAAYREVEFTDVEAGKVFAAYRFTVNHLYTQLLLTDLSPAERLFLCHAVSETVETLTGSTWQDKLLPATTAQGA